MFHYCPKCRSSNLEFTNQHYLFCPACDFSYFHNVAASVAAIITYQGSILFTLRANAPGAGLLDLPGGFVGPQESLEQALSREIREELAIEIEQWQYLCSKPNTYPYKDINYHTLDSVFVSHLAEKPECVIEAAELSEILWLKPEQLDVEKLAFSSTKAAIRYYIQIYG